MSGSIKVLIVDDSALMRQLLSVILESDPQIEVVGAAPDALKARELIKLLNPDVVTLDIEMPKMNGIEFLKKIMTLRPMPVVMISSLTQTGADITLKALEIGAVDFIGKPQTDLQRGMSKRAHEIIDKVKTAAKAKVSAYEADTTLKNDKKVQIPNGEIVKKMVVVGASTGGVEALRAIISKLPIQMPPIFIVQHMPKQFTSTFAKRLDSMSTLTVQEATDGMIAKNGHVYIAPGDRHLVVCEENDQIYCRLEDGGLVSGHIPSADVLFDSACDVAPEKTVGLILSGMGRDGTQGLLKLKENGSHNIGQSKQTCVVYGMPKAAYEKGALHQQEDLNQIADNLVGLCVSQ